MQSENETLLHRLGGENLLGWHHSNGESIESSEYLERYRRVLLSGLSRSRLIYLDTNYWIRLRDAELGRGKPEAIRLLQTLRAMVRSREVLCVSHLHSFLEIGKQEEDCLRVTASLLDEFAESVAISSPNDLLAWECSEFIRIKLGLNLQSNLCVWTKVGQIHTHKLPDKMPRPATQAGTNAVLKALIDTQWSVTFEEIFTYFNWETKSRLNADIDPQVLAQIEERKKEQYPKGLSREQIRRYEFSEVVSFRLRPIFTELISEWHRQHGFPDGLSAVLRQLGEVLTTAKNEFNDRTLGHFLPCVAIPTELYTLYETNHQKRTPLTNNDNFDWNHAAAALAYCDMFFTERHLAHQLRNELKADKQYGCEVFGNLDEVLKRLHDKR